MDIKRKMYSMKIQSKAWQQYVGSDLKMCDALLISWVFLTIQEMYGSRKGHRKFMT